jgi:hypothetical protein
METIANKIRFIDRQIASNPKKAQELIAAMSVEEYITYCMYVTDSKNILMADLFSEMEGESSSVYCEDAKHLESVTDALMDKEF